MTAGHAASRSGTRITEIGYKGGGDNTAAIITRQVDFQFDNMVFSLPQMRAGKMKALAVTSRDRLPTLPDIPTIAETLPGFEATQWFGILAPAGTPRPIILRLNKEIQAAVAWPEYQSKLNAAGATPASSASPEEFATLIANLTELWGRIPRRMGLNFD